MELAKISSKGQIVIPRKVREGMKINEGSILAVEQVNDLMIIKKVETNLEKQFKKSLEDLKLGKIKKVA